MEEGDFFSLVLKRLREGKTAQLFAAEAGIEHASSFLQTKLSITAKM